MGETASGATYGLYPNRVYALNLAASLAAEAGQRTHVKQFNSRLWEIDWAAPVSAQENTDGS